MREHQMDQEMLSNLTRSLSKKYPTAEDILGYLTDLNASMGDSRWWGYVPLIESWAKQNPEAILEIVRNPNLEPRIPELFRNGFLSVAARSIDNFIESFAQKLMRERQIRPLDMDRLIQLLIQNKVPPDVFMPWMERLVPRLDESGTRLVLGRSYFLFAGQPKEQQRKIVRLLQLAVNNGLSSGQLDDCYFLIRHILEEEMAEAMDLFEVNEIILSVLRHVKELNYHSQQLLNLIIGQNLGNLLDFIGYRLTQNRARSESYLNAVPFRGFVFMPEAVRGFDDFCTLMDHIIKWRENDLISLFDIDDLLKNVVEKADEENGNYLVRYVNRCLSEDRKGLQNAITASYALSFQSETIEVYLNLLKRAQELGTFKEAKNVFVHNVLSGEYSSNLGEAPPALINKRDCLATMRDRCQPGEIRSLIEYLIENLETEIQEMVAEDQGILDPKL